jgi:hypothetical protein
MNCPKCGEVCSCVLEPSPGYGIPEVAVSAEISGITESETPGSPGEWRDELADRLNRYRARRKAPPPRYPSLRLPFEKVAYSTRTPGREASVAPIFEANSNHALALDDTRPDAVSAAPPIEEPQEQFARISIPLQQASAKIIEFPRFAWAPPVPPPDQLAEPVGEQLRILEVPEFQPSAPALGGITIEPIEAEPIEKRLGIDIPLQIAPLRRRLAASAVDAVIVACASALFGLIFWKVAAVRPPQLQFLSIAAGILTVFWAVYEYLLIVYSGSTPGLRAAGLELTRFDGSATTRAIRRWRILCSYLSALSLGMGYVWVFLDEDSLCWHDRITRSHFGLKTRTEMNRSE